MKRMKGLNIICESRERNEMCLFLRLSFVFGAKHLYLLCFCFLFELKFPTPFCSKQTQKISQTKLKNIVLQFLHSSLLNFLSFYSSFIPFLWIFFFFFISFIFYTLFLCHCWHIHYSWILSYLFSSFFFSLHWLKSPLFL